MKFGIYTLGCKVNTYESEYVKNLLLIMILLNLILMIFVISI